MLLSLTVVVFEVRIDTLVNYPRPTEHACLESRRGGIRSTSKCSGIAYCPSADQSKSAIVVLGGMLTNSNDVRLDGLVVVGKRAFRMHGRIGAPLPTCVSFKKMRHTLTERIFQHVLRPNSNPRFVPAATHTHWLSDAPSLHIFILTRLNSADPPPDFLGWLCWVRLYS